MSGFRENRWLSLQAPGGFKGLLFRFAAVGETLFVLLGLIVLARLIFRGLGFADSDTFLFGEGIEPDFRAAAIAEGIWHATRYGLIFLAIFIIGMVRKRRGRISYGLGTGGHSVASLVAFGLGLFVVMHIPALLLRLIDTITDIGPGTPFWELMANVEWDRDFWLFMAVSSFLVVPIVEEIVARGYILGRFRESFSPGGALLLMALLFAAAHSQYHKPDLYSIGSLVALVWGSVLMGYAVYRTQSLIPAIIAHALVNVPTTLQVDYAIAGLIVLALYVFRRAYLENARRLGAILGATDDWLGLVLAGGLVAALGLTLQATSWAPYAWLAGLVVLFAASLFIKSRWDDAT